MRDEEGVIERTLQLTAPIDVVWRAISEPEELSRWFGDEAELTLEEGSEGAMIWDRHGSFAVKVEEVIPPTRLVWSWVHEPGVPFDDAPSTRVEWTLTVREDGGTTLRLRESGFRTDRHFDQNEEGWTEELAELVALVER